MDERKTLDFNDLMEGGDQIPGFEVAKVTSANKNTNSNDAVLHTPTHNEDKIAESNVENSEEDNTSIDNAKQTTSDAKTDGQQAESMNEDDIDKLGTADYDVAEMNGEMSDMVADDGVNSDVNDVMTIDDDKDTTETVDISEESNDKENEDGEPVKKKKKMYLQPPRPKMNLWGGSKQQTNHGDNKHDNNDVSADDDDIVVELDIDETSKSSSRDVQELDDDPSTQNGETEESGDKEESENKPMEEEEDPHQQSFLSFLNLKPGSSKPQETEKNAEESKKEAFYSRKRLRTRKKVSYYEDVVLDDDEEYNVDDEEEDEDIEDHMMESTSRNRTNRARSRTNSKSPGKPQPASYTAALQNLLPGIDLTCLKQTPTPIAPAAQRSSLPKIGPKSFMNRMAIANNSAMVKTNSSGTSAGSTGKGLFECGLCGTFFNTASQFIAHQETMHGEKQIGRSAMETFRCEVCGFVLTNRFAYQEHKRMKHGNKNGPLIFNCTKCKVGKFFSLAALQKHQLACGAPFCSTCGATFSTWVAVAEHRRKAHTDPGQTRQWLNCVNKLCKFKCVTQAEMRQHVQQHHMLNEIFTCNAPKCSRVFTSRDDLTEHKKEAHASEFIVQYQCMECKNCFSSKTLLAEHQYLHTLEKLRKCDLCSRHFASIVELRKHKDVHAVKGSVRCQSCLRWCNDKLELVNHVCAQKRRTSGIRLYFCDVCHKDFRSDQKMFLHRKEHKNFFQCAICFWECTSESDYFEHRLTHGKHTCSECCEELDLSMIEFHKKAHKYYIKLEDMEDNGKNEKVMVLYPNLVNVIKA